MLTQRYIIDLEPALHQYRRSAPSVLSNYVDFKDFIDIIINVEPLPYYQEEVAVRLYEIITNKLNETQMIVSHGAEIMDTVDLYVNSFVSYIDSMLMNIIDYTTGGHNYESYSIENWVDYKSPILLVKSTYP